MTENFRARYQLSQENLRMALEEQIHRMLPLRYDYTDLQCYLVKVQSEFESLLRHHNQISQSDVEQLRQMFQVGHQLEQQRNVLMVRLKQIEKQKAQRNLDRKNCLSLCQTLNERHEFEREQSIMTENGTAQVLHQTELLNKNIHRLKLNLENLETDIQTRIQEQKSIESDINITRLQNENLAQNKAVRQAKIDQISGYRNIKFAQIRRLRQEKHANQGKMQLVRGQNAVSHQTIIEKKRTIQNLRNQKAYIVQLIENEEKGLQETIVKEKNLQRLVDERKRELDDLEALNVQLELKMTEEKERLGANENYVKGSKIHLRELIETNRLLMKEMSRCCEEDVRIGQLLEMKAKKNVQLKEKFNFLTLERPTECLKQLSTNQGFFPKHTGGQDNSQKVQKVVSTLGSSI